jgi:SAM-dependent methyltransferase
MSDAAHDNQSNNHSNRREALGAISSAGKQQIGEKPSTPDSSIPRLEDGTPDIRVIMADIRESVRQAGESDSGVPFAAKAANFSRPDARAAGELLHSEELRFLNTNYNFSQKLHPQSLSTHRNSLLGRIVLRLKRKFLGVLRDSILKDYLESEREFQANLVRLLNDTVKYVDSRDAANFWELIEKIDVDVSRALDRIEAIADEHVATLRSAERALANSFNSSLSSIQLQITSLATSREEHGDKLATLQSVISGLESTLVRYSQASAQLGTTPVSDESASARGQDVAVVEDSVRPTNGMPNIEYLALENRFRGDQSLINQRMSIYPEYFQDLALDAPVLEIGCGRGELLSLFAGRGIAARGVDLDQAMVDVCREKQLDVVYGDGISHLRDVPPNSLAGVIAVQVVEHLNQTQLRELIRLCFSRVKPGGRVIFETINPRSLLALSSNYFRDPTHVWPLHPDLLEWIMSLEGFKETEVRLLSPVPEEALLKKLALESYMTPRWAFTVQTINHNIERLNDLLFGYQDYCLVASVPEN